MAPPDTLLLSQGYQPVKVIPWQRAICMSFLGKVEVVTHHPDASIRTASRTFPAPAVVRLLSYHRATPPIVRFSRRNVYLRDGFVCQYCGDTFRASELTLDHVVPRAQGGTIRWENVVAACGRCNRRKGNRTPDAAGMPLLRPPARPTWLPPSAQLGLRQIPACWADWLAE